MATMDCPHCGAVNQPDAQFCESCGMALPDASAAGPRVVTGQDLPATETGQTLQAEEMKKQAKKAAGALLAVAIIQVIFGTVVLMAPRLMEQAIDVEIDPTAYVFVYGIGVVFFGLYLWARRAPFPAAIVGLVLFLSIHLLDAVADPRAIARGILVKVIIVVVLVKAIQAGGRHRQLLKAAQS